MQRHRELVNNVVCVIVPEAFHALGFWRRDFDVVMSDTDFIRGQERANASMLAASTRC